MKAISAITRAKIKGYLEGFLTDLVQSHTAPNAAARRVSGRAGTLKPFHKVILPKQLLSLASFERSFSTRLGTTFEECARLIALDHYEEVRRGYDIHAPVNIAALNMIEQHVALFEHRTTLRPKFDDLVESLVIAADQPQEPRTIRADLYLRATDSTEYLFELKTPLPNKGQCLEVTQRLLRFHLFKQKARPQLQAYFAMAYNPYGTQRSDYRWEYARSYTPFDDVVLIGAEFWSLIGGPTTYTELLEIYQEVGHERSKYIIDSLIFDF
jgi:hypothetical protein